MPTWEIVGLVILGILLFIAAIRIGLIGLFFDILGAVLGGLGGGGGGSSFGGGSSGGGGSSSDD
jgi:uncharacterized protein